MSVHDKNISVRSSRPEDTSAIHELVGDLTPLTPHTWYTYWNLFSNFGNSCFIAENNKRPVGFITSHPTTTPPQEWFIWQVGIKPDYRGSGLVERLQDHVVDIAREAGAIAIRTTIEADNPRSYCAFNKMAVRLGATMEEITRFNANPKDASSPPEVLYRIALVS